MWDDNSFPTFMRRIRAGDEAAAAELVRRYESAIRVAVRAHVTDPSLYRFFDSQDICQSVLGSFFVRAAAGEYDLESPQQLVKLLMAMARNKVAFHARKHRTQSRDHRREIGVTADELDALGNGPGPEQIAAGKDLLEALRARLTVEERQVADLRAAGCSWPEIAGRLGGTAEGRRKQLTRALDRVTVELGLEPAEED